MKLTLFMISKFEPDIKIHISEQAGVEGLYLENGNNDDDSMYTSYAAAENARQKNLKYCLEKASDDNQFAQYAKEWRNAKIVEVTVTVQSRVVTKE